MAQRRPNLLAAVIDLAFAIGCGLCGVMGWGFIAALGVVTGHIVYWAVSRWNTLSATPRPNLVGVVAVSVAILGIVDLTAFWLGTLLHQGAP
ncbi:MAG: hypothetical protein AB7J28_07030 [Hyphomonadaceae bacterium]